MSADRPRVTVCLATYNQAPYIEDCVLSVLAQAADVELELLLGDDGSSDGTADIVEALCARFPGQITFVRRPTNIGGTENYQDLVRRATGEYIAHLDGDDAWLPGKLRAQMAFLAAHPECAAVYTNAVAVSTGGKLLGPFTGRHPVAMPLAYVVAKGSYLMHSSLLYRAQHRNAFTALAPPVIDYAIHLAFAQPGPLGFIDQPLALYRVATPTSTVRNNYPLVQRLLWDATRNAARDLPPAQRGAAAAHSAAEALIARALGRTASLEPLLTEIAALAGGSRALLVVRALPCVVEIGIVGVLRHALRRVGLARLLAEQPRV